MAFKSNHILINGFMWSFVGKIGYIAVSLMCNIVLARILGPDEFGQVAIVMFFILLANVLVESGLGGALIRKNEISDTDYSTVFIFNLAISLFISLVIILSANYIAGFYDDHQLKYLLLVSSLLPIINSTQCIVIAKLTREFRFKHQSVYNLISIISASIIGIFFAIKGFGVWSIIIVHLTFSILLSLIYFVYEKPLKTFIFSKKSFLMLYKFGLNTTLANLISTIFDNIYHLIIGKYFSINQTGLYYQAKKLEQVPVGVIKSSSLGVIYSYLSKHQENRDVFHNHYKKIFTTFTIVVGIITSFSFLYAEFIIKLLYGNDWVGAAIYLQLLSIASFFYLLEILNRIIFKVFDKTSKILILELLKKCIQLTTIVIGIIQLRIDILLYGLIATNIFSYLLNFYFTRSLLPKFSFEELITTGKVLLAALISTLLIYYFKTIINIDDVILAIFSMFLWIISYFTLIWIMKISIVFNEIKALVKLIIK